MPKKERELSFSGTFATDIALPGMMFASVVRSAVPSGKIKSVSLPGGTGKMELISAADVPGRNAVSMLGTDAEIFCTGDIRYKGEPVALVVGEDEREVRDAARKADVVVELDFSRKKADGERTAIIAARTEKSAGFSQDDFGTAPFVVDETWENAMRPLSMKETNAAAAYFDGDRLSVYAPNQWIHNMRESLSACTGIPRHKISVTRTPISKKSSSAIFQSEIAAAMAAIASIKTGRPVKLSYTRSEQESFVENPARITVRHKTAVSEDGRIIADDIRITADTGAYCPFAEEIAERLLLGASGIYKAEKRRVSVKILSSKNPPRSVKMKAIAMHDFFAAECQMQRIAEVTGISPKTLRKANLDAENALFDGIRIADAIDAVTQSLDPFIRRQDLSATKNDDCRTRKEFPGGFDSSAFDRKFFAYRMRESGTNFLDTVSPSVPNKVGTALACAVEGIGYAKRPTVLRTELHDDGKFVIESFPVSDADWGAWTRTVSDILKIDRTLVFLDPKIDEGKENNWPDTLSENTGIKARLLKECCAETRENLATGIRRASAGADAGGKPFVDAAFAACIVEVEIDACTLSVGIQRISVAFDCGRIQNKPLMEMQARLEIQKQLPQLMEGKLLSCNDIRIQFMESDGEPKQIGNIIDSVVPAAFASAVSVARGRTISRLPITERDILG